jgi:tryptophanyl-tRNA synthetase
VYEGCRTAGIGCIECKGWVADNVMAVLAPIQERRRPFEQNPKLAWDVLEAGSARARIVAQQTIEQAREAMNMSHLYQPPGGSK